MKSILALVGGGDRDPIIIKTALAAALPLSAHLDFLHVRVPAAQAARAHHTEFARGAAIGNALDEFDTDAQSFANVAARNVRELCANANVELCESPSGRKCVSASFREESSNELERLNFHARHSDLVVIGRAKQKQGLTQDTLEHLILNSGRPILVAASSAPESLTGTVLVCWKECSNAARALAAAMPLLAHAQRIVFASVAEPNDAATEAVNDLARKFSWSGIPTEVRILPPKGRAIPKVIADAVAECGADLMVMGAYGRSRTRSLIFGSCTEAFIGGGDKPILLMH